MSLPFLYSAPADQDEWQAWAFNHAAIHYDIVNALQTQKNVAGLQQFMLHPIDFGNFGIFLYYHQTMHNQANAALGTSGFDLLEVDLNNPSDLRQWLQMNGDEHQRFNAVLQVD